eukprot:scaffold1167_cov418-Prasinococcus_capsulatus_cf.AAC.16
MQGWAAGLRRRKCDACQKKKFIVLKSPQRTPFSRSFDCKALRIAGLYRNLILGEAAGRPR